MARSLKTAFKVSRTCRAPIVEKAKLAFCRLSTTSEPRCRTIDRAAVAAQNSHAVYRMRSARENSFSPAAAL